VADRLDGVQGTGDFSFQSFKLRLHIFLFIYGFRYYLGDQIKKNETGKVCGMYRREECAYRVLVGKPGGKRPLAVPCHRWENNIKWLFKRKALVNTVMILHVPQTVGNFLTS
jgi:hypothetical protein